MSHLTGQATNPFHFGADFGWIWCNRFADFFIQKVWFGRDFMKKVWVFTILCSLLLLGAVHNASAVPTQYGDSGLISQPSAETLNAGNICLGVWSNFSSGDEGDALIVPVGITIGLGTFFEMYGSYPNLLFNDDEVASGRGYTNLGGKIRFLGKRSSRFKMSVDAQAQRTISDNPDIDGLTDYMGRVIASLKLNTVGLHINGGYKLNEDPNHVDYDNQAIAGAGIEFYPTGRIRMIAEGEWRSNKISNDDDYAEVTIGVQYFVSPHFTLNLGGSVGLEKGAPDWRVIAGVSGCQGIGTYQRPIPKLIEQPPPEEVKPKDEKKAVKIKTLTPLAPVSAVGIKPIVASPVSKLEVAVEPDTEKVIVEPSEKLVIPATTELQALNVSPIAAVPPTASAPVVEEPIQTVVYRKFEMDEFIFDFDQYSLTDAGREALALVADELRQDDKWFIIRFDGHTDSTGSVQYNERLSLKRAVSTATSLVVNNGFDPNRIFVKGYGESKPLLGNDTAEGRSRNRRVEILVLVEKSK
jgi:outer membrane protein OmpA-like peptidoglycan-associated protein